MGCAIYRIVADIVCSTLMYIEAEAKMDSYEAQDGSARTSLNLLQRKSPTQEDEAMCLTKLQATSRPSQDRASRTAARLAAPRARLMPPTSLSAALALLKQHGPGEGSKRNCTISTLCKGLDKQGTGNSLQAWEVAGSV